MSDVQKTIERLNGELATLRNQVDEQGIRLTLAQAWIDLYQYAYDTLLHYGINFRKLDKYNEDAVLEEAAGRPISDARTYIVKYISDLTSDIGAAIRRKQFRLH